MSKEAEMVAKPAEAVASEFVSSLGLSDMIIGGLAIYCRYVGSPHEFKNAFLSTGYDILNVALLVCAAALVGKVVTLIIAAAMAIVNLALRKLRYDSELAAALTTYCADTGRTMPSRRQAEAALAFLRRDAPSDARRIDSIRTQTILVYGAATVAFIYASRLATASHSTASPWPLRLAAILLMLLGVLQQADRFIQTIATLGARSTRKEDDDGKN